MTTPKTATAATKVEETKAAKDIATLPVAAFVVGSAEATKEVAPNSKGTHATNGTLTARDFRLRIEKAVKAGEFRTPKKEVKTSAKEVEAKEPVKEATETLVETSPSSDVVETPTEKEKSKVSEVEKTEEKPTGALVVEVTDKATEAPIVALVSEAETKPCTTEESVEVIAPTETKSVE
ncbi:hypothetical protein R1flu_004428 [Riccia fluitans]|uniref:Uncharacterized protein n=1 Tax=Riccia fluitans TaxID=41844 RepID=A0ABD1YT68_9MARC